MAFKRSRVRFPSAPPIQAVFFRCFAGVQAAPVLLGLQELMSSYVARRRHRGRLGSVRGLPPGHGARPDADANLSRGSSSARASEKRRRVVGSWTRVGPPRIARSSVRQERAVWRICRWFDPRTLARVRTLNRWHRTSFTVNWMDLVALHGQGSGADRSARRVVDASGRGKGRRCTVLDVSSLQNRIGRWVAGCAMAILAWPSHVQASESRVSAGVRAPLLLAQIEDRQVPLELKSLDAQVQIHGFLGRDDSGVDLLQSRSAARGRRLLAVAAGWSSGQWLRPRCRRGDRRRRGG